MEKKLHALVAISALALGLTACSDRTADAPPGHYEKTTRSTDSNGTTTVQKSSSDVEVDENGNKTAVVKSKTTKDPRGLFNKTTTQSEEVIQEKQ